MSKRLKLIALSSILFAVGTVGNSVAQAQESRSSEVAPADPDAATASEEALPVAQPAPGTQTTGNGAGADRFAIGFQASTLGIGGQFAFLLTHSLNVRAGFNLMSFGDTITKDQVTYGAHLHFRSVEAHLDWFFLGPLHLSPGLLLYNGNSISANVSVPTGQTFTLNGVSYESGTPPLGGAATLSLNKVAPSIMFGIGNMIPRNGHHFSGQFDIGGIYEGSPNIGLSLTGNVCTPPNTSGPTCQAVDTPSVQTNVTAEQVKLNHDAASFKFYPVIAGGFSFAF
jgi:hypothetical protein